MTDKPLPQPTPAEPRGLLGLLPRDEKEDTTGTFHGIARAEPRIETVPDEWAAELPRDNRFHDPFEAGAQPEPEEVRYQHWAAGTESANDPGSYEGWMARARAGSYPAKDDCHLLDAIMKAAKQIHEEFDCLGDHVKTKKQIREQISAIIWKHVDARKRASPPSSPGAPQTCPSCPHPAHSGDVCAEKIMPGVFCYCGVSSPGADTEQK